MFHMDTYIVPSQSMLIKASKPLTVRPYFLRATLHFQTGFFLNRLVTAINWKSLCQKLFQMLWFHLNFPEISAVSMEKHFSHCRIFAATATYTRENGTTLPTVNSTHNSVCGVARAIKSKSSVLTLVFFCLAPSAKMPSSKQIANFLHIHLEPLLER